MHAYSLMYHDVVADGAFDASGFPGSSAASYKLERDHFEHHLQAITGTVARLGYDRVSQPETLLRRSPSRQPAVLLHFDDGGKSALAIADAIERHGWRGYFHITTDLIDTPGFVTPTDIRELDQRGHVVGTHSCSHPPRMSSLRFDDMVREWRDSAAVLADITGKPITVASVPGGYTSREVVLAADRAGIEVLFNSEPVSRFDWVRGCVVLGRYTIKQTTGADEAAAIAAGRRRPRWQQWAMWNGKKALKNAGGTYWLALRKRIFDARAGSRPDRP
ncbi:MAG: polysaccharide deacetylase family protein [Proteobacteria bacterium]|nr:polysaccharide deacetylase family protein [Pseudomonadota bacterium]